MLAGCLRVPGEQVSYAPLLDLGCDSSAPMGPYRADKYAAMRSAGSTASQFSVSIHSSAAGIAAVLASKVSLSSRKRSGDEMILKQRQPGELCELPAPGELPRRPRAHRRK